MILYSTKHAGFLNMSWSDTWQLWVDFLSHVLHQVSGHLSSDVHQNSSFIGGDLIDQHRTGVSKNQLCVVGFELGTVLREQNTTLRLSRLSKDVAFCLTIQITNVNFTFIMLPTKWDDTLAFPEIRFLRNLEKQPSATMVRGAYISWKTAQKIFK